MCTQMLLNFTHFILAGREDQKGASAVRADGLWKSLIILLQINLL